MSMVKRKTLDILKTMKINCNNLTLDIIYVGSSHFVEYLHFYRNRYKYYKI